MTLDTKGFRHFCVYLYLAAGDCNSVCNL